MKRVIISLFVLNICSTFLGCREDSSSPPNEQHDRILRYFDAMGIDADEVEFERDRVVVQEDIVFRYDTLESQISRFEETPDEELAEKAYWYSSSFAKVVNVFPLCLDNRLSGDDKEAFNNAAMRWSQSHHKLYPGVGDTNIQIVSKPGCSGYSQDQTFKVTYSTSLPDTTAAEAEYPHERNGKTIPGDIRVNSNIHQQWLEINGTALHEMGHTLGFMHPGEAFQIYGTQAGGEGDYQTVMRRYVTSYRWYLYPDDTLAAALQYRPNRGNCEYYPDPRESSDGSFCNEECPCDFGEGDCDFEGTDQQCKSGLVCGHNNGAAYGLPSNYEVCVAGPSCPVFDPDYPDAGFCYQFGECPCGVGEGDCDDDADCGGDLVCGKDNGAAAGLYDDWDLCMHRPALGCPVFDRKNPDAAFCTEECPCGLGEGDCDNDSQCRNNLVCAMDVGAHFGLQANWDVCAMPGAFFTRLPEL